MKPRLSCGQGTKSVLGQHKMNRNLYSLLAERFPADRSRTVLELPDGTRQDYAHLEAMAGRYAALLRKLGVQPGDRVAILGKNSTDYFEVEFACIKLGAMMLPLNWRLAEPELLFILNDAAPEVLIYDAEFASRVTPLLAGSPLKHALRIDFGAPPADDYHAYEDAIAAAREHDLKLPMRNA